MISQRDNEIASAYITGTLSLRALAAEYQVPFVTIQRRCKREKWVEERAKYRQKVRSKALAKSADKDAAALSRLVGIADKLEDLIDKLQKKISDEEEVLYLSRTPCRELSDLSRAVQTALTVRRDLLGIPTQDQEERQRVARERLALEREKAQREAMAAETEREPVVITMGEDAQKYAK